MRYLSIAVAFLFAFATAQAQELPKMKFNDVAEIAPGVFFRYSSISATDKNVVFGGSNNIWIVFEDYVVVYRRQLPQGSRRRHRRDQEDDRQADPLRPRFAPSRRSCLRQRRLRQGRRHRHRPGQLRPPAAHQWAEGIRRGGQGAGRPQGRRRQLSQGARPDLRRKARLLRQEAARRVAVLRPRPHGRRRVALFAEAQDPLHRRCLRQRGVQLHGAFRFGVVDSRAGKGAAAGRQDRLPRPRSAGRQGRAGQAETLLRRAARAGARRASTPARISRTSSRSIDMPWHKEWTGDRGEHAHGRDAARFRRIDGPDDAVGPGRGFRHLRGAVADENGQGLERAEEDRRPGGDAGPARGIEADRAGGVSSSRSRRPKRRPRKRPAPTPCSASATPTSPRRTRSCAGFRSATPASRRISCRRSSTATSCVTNLQRIYGPNVADQAMALLLALTRGLAPELHKQDRRRRTTGRSSKTPPRPRSCTARRC